MLELKHLCFEAETDDGVRQILKDVSLTVDERMVVITGPNGSGKSTMAKLIAGIEQPTSGQILLDGEDITHMSITERARRGISFAFQQPVRFKGITVFDLISIASGKKLSTNEACTYLSEVGLCARDYVNREVNASLSGGELKRIEIATMLARGTKMSIFDEPEAGIDLWSFQNLISVFEKMHETIHGSILIISHQERILETADKIVVLVDGEIRAIGSKDEIMPVLMQASSVCSRLADKVWGRESPWMRLRKNCSKRSPTSTASPRVPITSAPTASSPGAIRARTSTSSRRKTSPALTSTLPPARKTRAFTSRSSFPRPASRTWSTMTSTSARTAM